jgi:glycerophosphoryl diester phosphodiesterase
MKRADIFILSTRSEIPTRGIGAHQGDYANFPDDTVSALRSGARLGAHFAEFDIQRCRTGEFVVIHDHELSRTTSLTGIVQDCTFEYIRSGHIVHRGKPWPNEKVPTLEEALDALPKDNFLINLHCYWPGVSTVARDVALRVKALGRLDQCYVAARLPDLELARAAVQELKTCNMTRPSGVDYYRPWTDEQNAEYLRTTIENKCQYLQLRQPWPRKFSDMAHAAGVKVNLCTCDPICNDPKYLEYIFNDLDIDYVLTENLGPMVEAYNKRILPTKEKENRK